MTDTYLSFLKNKLKNHGYDWENLPIINLNGQIGHTDYIDFIQYDEMTAPVMKYIDIYDRPGIVLRINQKVSTDNITDNKPIKGTLAIFQRYTNNPVTWSYGWGNSSMAIEHTYSNNNLWCTDHNTKYKGMIFNDQILDNLLFNQDQLFYLG